MSEADSRGPADRGGCGRRGFVPGSALIGLLGGWGGVDFSVGSLYRLAAVQADLLPCSSLW